MFLTSVKVKITIIIRKNREVSLKFELHHIYSNKGIKSLLHPIPFTCWYRRWMNTSTHHYYICIYDYPHTCLRNAVLLAPWLSLVSSCLVNFSSSGCLVSAIARPRLRSHCALVRRRFYNFWEANALDVLQIYLINLFILQHCVEPARSSLPSSPPLVGTTLNLR